MAQPKPLASLSSALLARSPGDQRNRRRMALGPVASAAPAVEGESVAVAGNMPEPAPAKRIAFTLRLDPMRHRQLKQASAKSGRSAQHFLTEALDAFLQSLPGEAAPDALSDTGQHANRWGLIR